MPLDRTPEAPTRQRRVTSNLDALAAFISAAEVIAISSDGFLTITLRATDPGLVVASGALGVDLGIPLWRKRTFAFGAFSAAALTNDIELLSLPAGGIIEMVKIKHSTAFAGTGITAMTLSVGITGDLVKYAPEFDVFQAVGDTIFQVDFLPDTEDHASATSIRVAAESVGANLDQLSQGSVDIWVKYSVVV